MYLEFTLQVYLWRLGELKLAGEHPEMFAAVASVCAPTDRVMFANIKIIRI